MADENYSTYQWVPDTEGVVSFGSYNIDSSNNLVTVKATITHTDIFALIVGTYQVTVEGAYKIDNKVKSVGGNTNIVTNTDNFTVLCTGEIQNNPKLCTGNDGNYTVELTLTGIINLIQNAYEPECTGTKNDFKIQQGIDNRPNKYLCILQKPELITNLTINGNRKADTYVKGSALPINEIENISTIDFNNITINGVQRDIFYKLENNMSVTTNDLFVPELTVVDLPESEYDTIYICKSRSKNKGITFKTKDPDISNKHFGYIIDIEGDRSAGYNSVWVNRETLDKMFKDMPADIMSNTNKFVFDNAFELHKLTYEVHDVEVPDWVNNSGQRFNDVDLGTLSSYAPTYKKVTINESTETNNRRNNMILKNIEFVKFDDKVIKLNYKPLYEA